MALSPIQIFQQQQSPLTALLQTGTSEISRIMDRAIQVGRDIANKQVAQEQDLLAMRRNETNLAQRRAENLQQDWEDVRRFARGAYEFDVKFGADQGYRQQQLGMDQARMAQQASQFDASLGLQEQAGQRAQQSLDLQTQKFNAEEDARRREREGIAGLFTTTETASPKTSKIGMGPYTTEVTVNPSPTDIFGDYAKMEQVYQSDAATPEQKAKARARMLELKTQMPSGSEDEGGLTPSQQMSAERLRMSKEKAAQDAQRQEMESLIADTGAFVPQVPQTRRRPGATQADLDEAEVFDRNRFEAEVQAAKNRATADEYVNLVPNLSESQKAKRRKLWEYANGQTSAAPSGTGAVRSIPGLPTP